MTPHQGHAHGGDGLTLAAVALLAAVTLGYLVLAGARRREPRGWSGWRTAGFLAGSALLVLGLVPRLSPFPPGSFTGHMQQHLLVGMYAPIGLVLGAPVTLLLRSVPAWRGRLVGRALRSRPSHLVANPVTALVLNLGGLAALYLTPLYDATTSSPLLHHAVHAHFLAAGYLFAWVVAGPDPAPRRPSVPARLVVLGVAIAGHAVLSQLLYAGALVQVSVPAGDRRTGAELMYYGGDVAELALAVALVTTWRPAPVRGSARPGPVVSSRTRAPLHPAAPSTTVLRTSREPWSEPVAAICDVCGKKPSFGHNVSHSHRKTNRRWSPNIQRVRTMVNGVTPRRINACTSCLKAGKVLKPTV